jgi:peptidoglycan/LPS O-acetylase OafA/YrhL
MLKTNTNNNFDFLRMVFAVFVMITHSCPLSGAPECDFLCSISDVQIGFSYLGLIGFFTISGFLISKSILRSKSLINYFWNRILRIYPALIVVLCLTVILAPIIYSNESVNYLSNRDVWTYIPNNLFIYKLQSGIEGVFENNPLKHVINSSLWTLCFEFTLYILAALLFIFKRSRASIILAIATFIFFSVSDLYFSKYFANELFLKVNSKILIELGVYFIGGSCLALIEFEKYNKKKTVAILSLAILLISLYFHKFYYFKHLLIPIIIFLGFSSTKYINDVKNRIGDISYGVYIYGFPVQQTLQHFFKLNSTSLMIYSIFVSLMFGFLSWHLIEKNALKLKQLDLELSYQKIKSLFSSK